MLASSGMAAPATIDNRFIAAMRLVLAASALLITYINPSEPDRLVAVTYTALGLYTLYSTLLYLLALRCSPWLDPIGRWSHWIDVAWYLVLIALSSGTSSIFFFFFFFAILVASFRWGFRSGFRITIVSAALFTIIGYATAPSGSNFELNRFLLRPIYLLVLGYMIAYAGGFEQTLKRRLALLKEVTTFANPRFGIDRTIGALLERLRSFYEVEASVLVTRDQSSGQYLLRRATQRDAEAGTHADPIPAELGEALLAQSDDAAVVYGRKLPLGTLVDAYNVHSGEPVALGEADSSAIAATFDASAFVSVPWRYRGETTGRLYVLGNRRTFEPSDADFLLHVIEQVTPVLDNIRLVDQLASSAAEEERQRIARDLHDSVIQPYIGLQMGLSAIQQSLADGQTDITGDIERLLAMTSEGIAELRGYVRGLRTPAQRENSLLPAVQRFGAKFAEATGIDVQIKASADMRGNDRLAAEVFQMIAEGLSNVRRHTHARHAVVDLQRANGRLLLQIENDAPGDAARKRFTPRSITERAAALGGQARVEQRDERTAVIVEVPL